MDGWIIVLGVVPFLIGMCGQVARKLVLGTEKPKNGWRGWRKVYWATLPIHAMLVGGGTGFLLYKFGAPVPDVFGKELGGYILGYTLSGGVSVVGYDVIVKTIRRILGSFKFAPESGQPDPLSTPRDNSEEQS